MPDLSAARLQSTRVHAEQAVCSAAREVFMSARRLRSRRLVRARAWNRAVVPLEPLLALRCVGDDVGAGVEGSRGARGGCDAHGHEKLPPVDITIGNQTPE